MFIDEGSLININIYYRKSKNVYIVYTEQEFNELKNEEEKKKYSCLKLKMRELTWGLYNQLQDDAMVDRGDGERKFNYKSYKENRMKKLIKEWDAVDKDNKPVPINDNSLAHLAPLIAETILRSYDEISILGEKEEGK